MAAKESSGCNRSDCDTILNIVGWMCSGIVRTWTNLTYSRVRSSVCSRTSSFPSNGNRRIFIWMFRTASWYFGIHHILNFLEISMLAQDGWNYLNPIGTCGNVAQAGAVLAVAIKAASNKTKQVAYPACLSALLGITEPAVFGVNLKFMKPFVMSMIGGGVGGFLASIFHLRATGMSITGIPGTLLYLNEQLPLYILVNVVAFGVAFGLTWMFGFNKKMEQ